MAKPARSPVLGYNHNVRYHGRVFHVQTEDSGPSNPRLYTHLFYAGTILSSKKHEYDAAEHEDNVKILMQRLHKAMIKELTHGEHDPRIAAFFGARGEPAILEEAGAAAAPVAAAAAEAAPAAGAAPGPDLRMADMRTVGGVSGSIDTEVPKTPVPPPPAPALPSVQVAPAAVVVAAPASLVAAPASLVAAPASLVAAPASLVAPAPAAVRPQVTPRPVVMKPGDTRRPPVVLSSSADGAVVQRNVIINVGGGAAPVNGQRERGTRPRPAIPYVVRDGSYALPTATRGAGAAPTQQRAEETQPIATGRDTRMPRDAGRPVDPAAAARARTPGPPPDRTPRPGPPSERTPSDHAFSEGLVSDKRLDEVILEYLSEDGED
jgi:hypothetical protein